MTKREFLDTVFALVPNEANKIMDAFDEYVESNVAPTGRSGKERRMSKYIIEIPDDVQYVLFNGKADGKFYTAVHPVAELEILNSDYINEHYGELQDAAYQRGHDDGYEAGCATAFKPVSDAEYQRGLEDAWEAARKIALMDTETSENVTGYFGLFRIMENLTAMQAIAKLKAYEDKHPDCIEVGDEVINNVYNSPAIVTNVSNAGIYVLWKDGSGSWKKAEQFRKTGKHYDIQSILEAMRTHD